MPLTHLLDTSVYSQPIKKTPVAAAMNRWETLGDTSVVTSVICEAEVLFGIRNEKRKNLESKIGERYEALLKGKFDFEDFLEQMQQVKKMGSITSLLGLLPGMGQMKEALAQVDDRDLDRIAAIIQSMTPQERRDTKVLNGSRRLRIAKGSGVTVSEVNNLVERFHDAQKMMRQMGGMAGLPGMGRKAKRAQQGKKGKKGPGRAGGGPSKAAGKGTQPGALPGGLADGMPQLPQGLPKGFQLPDRFPGQAPKNGPDPLGLRRPR